MAIELTIPRLGWTMEEGTFVGWLKREGEPVKAGEPLFTLEGEKATSEVEATDSGILHISCGAPKPGSTVRVGARLGYLLAEGESVPVEESSPAPASASARPEIIPQTKGLASPVQTATEPASGGARPTKITISPRAMRAAGRLGVDWTQLRGTGRTGRIREQDVFEAVGKPDESAAPPQSDLADLRLPGRVVAISAMRRTIARRMSAGVHEAAPVTLSIRADATQIVRAREQFKAGAERSDEARPTLTDVFVKLCASSLERHPSLNAQWRKEGLFIPDEINIAIAVDTEVGLLAPVIRDVPGLTIHEVAAVSRALAKAAREGRLAAEELEGGTFTVTNLGGLGIGVFTPILNLPQCAVLGVGCITREPIVVGDQIVPGDVVRLNLTFDHRIVDGAPAARFLETLRQRMEEPAVWLDRCKKIPSPSVL